MRIFKHIAKTPRTISDSGENMDEYITEGTILHESPEEGTPEFRARLLVPHIPVTLVNGTEVFWVPAVDMLIVQP